MPQSSMDLIAARLAALERQQRALAAQPRLADASLDDTSLPIRDRSGSITGTIGKQPDGSFGTIVRNSPPQGTPTAAHLSAGEMGAVESTWDGNVTEGQVYEVHGHIEVHTALADGDVAPTPEDAHLASTIRDREGGTTTIVCSRPGTWWVWLRMVGADRVTKGEFSEPSQIEITELVDTGAIEERLDEAEQRIADARNDFEQGQAQLEDNLEHLNEVRLPGLESDLNSAIAAVQSDLDAFQQEWDENWDPAAFDELRDRADNLEQNIQDGLENADARIHRLAITDASNLFSDPQVFKTGQINTEILVAPTTSSGNRYVAERREDGPTNPYGMGLALTGGNNDWGHSAPITSDPTSAFWIDHEPGERYVVTGLLRVNGAPEDGDQVAALTWRRYNHDTSDSNYQWGDRLYVGTAQSNGILLEHVDGPWYRFRSEMAPDEGVSWRVKKFQWVLTARHGSGVDSRVDSVEYFDVHVRRMNAGELIVDGTVLARHIDTGDLTAHTAFIDQLDTNLLQARLLQADTALIDGVLLKDNAISARHLTVTNSEDLFHEAWMKDILDTTYVYSAGGDLNTTTFRTRFYNPNPTGLDDSPFDWRLTTLEGDLGIQTWPQNATTHQRAVFRLGPGKGILVRPGEQYTMRFRARDLNDGAFWDLRIALFDEASESVVPQSSCPHFDLRGIVQPLGEETVWTFTIPSDYPRMHMVTTLHSGNNTQSGARTFLRPQLFKAHDGKVIVDGTIEARSLNVPEIFSDEAVINKIWSDIVRARMLEADEAFIGGAVIMDDAIDVSKINVTESLAAALGEFLHLVTGSIEMNEFIANSGLVGSLEALGITLSDEGAGRRFEVSGQGWRLEDTTTGNTLSQMGLHGDDLLSMHDSETGEPTVSMTGAGGVSAVQLHSGEDMTIAGKSLVGRAMDTAPWHAAQSVLETVGQGAPRVFIRQVSGLSHSNSRAIAHLEAKIIPGRSYRISVPDFQMSDRQHYFMTAYYTTSSDPSVRPSTPTNSSAQLGTTTGRVPPSGLGWPSTTLSFEKVYGPRTAQWIRILFVVGNYEGTGITFGSTNTIAHNPRFLIQDLGPRVGDGGVLTWRDPSSALATAEPSDLVSQPYPILRTATYTWDPNTGDATRQGIDVEPRFGYWPDGTFYLTLVQFGAWDQGGQFNSVDVQSTVARWATSAGQVLQSGLTTITGTPPTSFHAPTENHRLPDLTRVGAGSTRRLPTEKEEEADQAAQVRASVLIGWSGWTGAHLNNAAAGVLHRNQTYAMLSTSTSTQD